MYAIKEGRSEIVMVGGVISADNRGSDWLDSRGNWTPCSDQAATFESEAEAEAFAEAEASRDYHVVEVD